MLCLAARAALTAAAPRADARLSILIFHRVLARPDPLFPNEVDAARFDRMMAAVRRTFHVLPLAQAAARLRDGSLPPRAMSITFDDGYADNEAIALPVLQRHQLPATFFVSTGFLDGGRMWNDTVIECLRHTDRDTIDLECLGLGRVDTASLAHRRAAIARVIPLIKYMDLQAREAALQALHVACHKPVLSRVLMMQRAQVQALHGAGMEIGAHTVNHPILTALADTVARQELASGRDQLQQMIDAPVQSLAYPNGGPDTDYDRRHVSMARDCGFEQAVSTAAGVSRTGDDVLQLPRFTPWDPGLARWMTRLVMNQRKIRFKVASVPC